VAFVKEDEPMGRFSDLDQYIEDARQSWPCPGVAVSIVKGDSVLHQNVYGLRDIENQLPMTEDTRFAMASVTKSFTAMSVALLVDEGKLEWDKPVREYMPEFILDDPYATQHVTVRDMLSHRTGLPRHDFAALRLDISRAAFIRRMKYLKFNATFREKFQYNNLMYYAAAYLVERIAGIKWEDFVRERIFTPLGMTASNLQPEPPQAGQFNALGYRVDRDEAGAPKGLIPMPFGPHTELSPGAAGSHPVANGPCKRRPGGGHPARDTGQPQTDASAPDRHSRRWYERGTAGQYDLYVRDGLVH
jgi:CubicO group peptidase (beta-lactamase class C family)